MEIQTENPDGILLRMIGVYWQFFLPIRARAREGRPKMLRSFAAALRHQGLLKVEEIGLDENTPYDSKTGDGFLLVEGRYLVDVIAGIEITPECLYESRRKNGHDFTYTYCLFNFGSEVPDWYPTLRTLFDQKEWDFWLQDEDDD